MSLVRCQILIFTLGYFIFWSPGSSRADGDNQLRVLCYNVHWALGTDGKYDVARLAKVINDSKPDLVALQEVDVGVRRSGQLHEVRELAKLTGLAARFGPTQHYQGGLFGNNAAAGGGGLFGNNNMNMLAAPPAAF